MLNLETLVFDLPEDVLKRKWAGDFEGEIELIDALLKKDIPEFLRDRLLVERRMAQMYPRQFNIPKSRALELMREKIPDFRAEELDELELDRAIEYIYIKGEKYYLRSFRGTLLKVNPDIAARAGEPLTASSEQLDEAIATMKEQGSLAYRFRIHGSLEIENEDFVPGAHVRVHMPLPQFCAQQSEISVATAEGYKAGEKEIQRTICFERDMAENTPFCVEYSYRSEVKYADPLSGMRPDAPLYPNAPAVTDDDLSEQAPHIVFTPYLRNLARELMGEETDPAKIAWKFYEYVTTKIRYSFMRSYFLIDRHAEYCALNGKGDCGIQAILFITLCRIAGIPARWQSGLCVEENRCGCHDWAQFYLDGYGWLFCDPSYGGSAYRKGAVERWKFYFGNLDPFRMVANSRYQTDFDPPKLCDRADPYDSQDGEVEMNGVGLLGYQFDTTYKTLEYCKL